MTVIKHLFKWIVLFFKLEELSISKGAETAENPVMESVFYHSPNYAFVNTQYVG